MKVTWDYNRQRTHWCNDYRDYNAYFGGDEYKEYSGKYNPPSTTVAQIRAKAQLFSNTQYVRGGSSLRQADCSFLVNYCYGTTQEGNHGISTSQYFDMFQVYGKMGEVQPKNGMILWRDRPLGHTALYLDGYTYEMAGTASGFKKRLYSERESYWLSNGGYILYSTNVDYDED